MEPIVKLSNKLNEAKFTLVTWKDSDIPDLILDCSYSGKLAPKPVTDTVTEPEIAVSQGTLKKKRAPKKSILASNENILNTEMASMLGSLAEKSNEAEIKQAANRLSNHFQFGNQTGAADSAMNKTSNNKLDQSLRISYAEMAQTLEAYKPAFGKSVEEVNRMYEEEYFAEWLRLLKYVGQAGLWDGVNLEYRLF